MTNAELDHLADALAYRIARELRPQIEAEIHTLLGDLFQETSIRLQLAATDARETAKAIKRR